MLDLTDTGTAGTRSPVLCWTSLTPAPQAPVAPCCVGPGFQDCSVIRGIASRQGVHLLRCSRRLCPAPSARRGTAAWPSPIANLWRGLGGGAQGVPAGTEILFFRLVPAACMLCALPAWRITTCGGRVEPCCTGNNSHTHTATGHVWLSHSGHARLSKCAFFTGISQLSKLKKKNACTGQLKGGHSSYPQFQYDPITMHPFPNQCRRWAARI